MKPVDRRFSPRLPRPSGAARTLLALALVPLPLLAAPPDAGQILREQQQLQPPATIPAPDLGLEPGAKPGAVRGPEGLRIKIQAFRFAGDTAGFDAGQLQTVVREYVGRELSFIELQQVADRITEYLRGQGYSLARAYLAAQEIQDGVVEITVLLGRVEGDADGGGIQVQADGARLDAGRIRLTVARAALADSPYLKLERLERGLLLLNDLPGVSARASLDPGSAAGTTRLTVRVEEGPLVSGRAWLDNYGNRYTGAGRLSAQLNLNDPGGRGDLASLAATGAEGLATVKLAYSLPLGYQGLRLGASYTHLRYEIGEELALLDGKGSANTGSLLLSYPVIRSRGRNLYASLSYDHKALKDESLGAVTSDKRVDVWNLGLLGNVLDGLGGGGLTNYALTLAVGELDLSRVASALATDQAGPRADGGYTRIGASLARLQRLSPTWALFAAVNCQWADGNLDSSEAFLLGGPTGVRAYPSGEASGSAGWVANLELRHDLPVASALGAWQLVAFYDLGHVTLHQDTWAGWNAGNPALANDYTLRGAGLGVNLTGKRHAVRLAYARKVGENPGRSAAGLDSDGRRDDSRVWLQALFQF